MSRIQWAPESYNEISELFSKIMWDATTAMRPGEFWEGYLTEITPGLTASQQADAELDGYIWIAYMPPVHGNIVFRTPNRQEVASYPHPFLVEDDDGIPYAYGLSAKGMDGNEYEVFDPLDDASAMWGVTLIRYLGPNTDPATGRRVWEEM